MKEDDCGRGLNEWAEETHTLAVAKGWWEGGVQARNLGEMLFLVTSELTELFDAYRKGKLDSPCDKPVPLSCLEEEMADTFIRLFDLCGALGIDLDRAVQLKHEFNKTRPYRHGNLNA